MKLRYLLLCFIYILFAPLVFGQASTIKINEFLIDPSPQIVELINTGTEIVDLSNWHIDDNGGTTYFTIPSGTQLYPNACVSFSGNYNFNRTTTDTVRLFDSSAPPTSLSAHLIDAFDYKASSGSGVTFQRIPDGQLVWATGAANFDKYNLTGLSCAYIPSPTPTSTSSPTPTETPTPTSTPLPTLIPTLIPTNATSPTSTSIPTPTQIPTSTHAPSSTPTQIPTVTIVPTNTPVPTATTIPTSIPEIVINNVYLSEVYPNPNDGENEWGEIYNDNSFPVTLSNWSIDDVENTGANPKSFSVTIPAYSFQVVDFTSSVFNNDGDEVRLINNRDLLVDSFTYTSSQKGLSIGRISFLSSGYCLQIASKNISNNECMVIESPTPTVTPTPTTTPLQTPTPLPSPTGIPEIRYVYLSEVYAYPNENEQEWLELYNDNSFSVQLQNWKIDDVADGGSSPKKINLTIPGYSFKAIDLSISMFNNDGDTVRLLNSDDSLIDTFAYDSSEKGKSAGRTSFDSSNYCIQNPSKEYFNNSCLIESSITPSPTPSTTSTPRITVGPTRTKSAILGEEIASYENNDDLVRPSRYYTRPTLSHSRSIEGHKDTQKEKVRTDPRIRTVKTATIISSIISFLTAGFLFIRIIL
ncbi:MAG: lamin tail domain-containing protein [Microgenomates group bacterium]